MLVAVRVIVSWMTILPMGTVPPPDRRLAGRAITALPLVGLLCGLVAAGVAFGLAALGSGPLLAGAMAVISVLVLTRGMHADALADTTDAFASYAPPGRALEIMHTPTAGPIGVAALVVTYLAQGLAIAELVDAGAGVALIVAFVMSRVPPLLLCRVGVPAAPTSGFGEIVAGTQGQVALAWAVLLLVAGGAALALGTGGSAADVPPWAWAAGAAVGVLLCLLTWAWGRHTVRRLGGITGDVLGASIEVSLLGALVAAVLLTGS